MSKGTLWSFTTQGLSKQPINQHHSAHGTTSNHHQGLCLVSDEGEQQSPCGHTTLGPGLFGSSRPVSTFLCSVTSPRPSLAFLHSPELIREGACPLSVVTQGRISPPLAFQRPAASWMGKLLSVDRGPEELSHTCSQKSPFLRNHSLRSASYRPPPLRAFLPCGTFCLSPAYN